MNDIPFVLLTLWVFIAFVGYVLVYGSVVLFIGWIIEKIAGREKAKRYIGKEVARFGRNAFRAIGAKVRAYGREKVPSKGPMVIISNHQSAFDIPLVAGYVRGEISFIAKVEVSKIPGLAQFVKRLDGVFIDRGNRLQTVGVIRNIMKILKNGGTIMLFPEGTRSVDGELQSFRKGSLALPYRMKVPIVPVALDGTKDIMVKGRLLVRPAKVRLKILDPVDPKEFESEEELEKHLQALIGKALKELRSMS
ncbi:acyl-phosphate glycerol 3-phosphate acyltransferase [Kosmotoga pacifica]|uniref:1-acyl-sn-glycerol-3-phosphate acyltransferase n=1 Tax=Kosmotoga pacifica TaxID=1330330 RepID=A0A0G2ZDY1_9BACT|nr:acyl-phosphate glycerol 3-phosphate acyltransferase [Kosmotoga pacifica]